MRALVALYEQVVQALEARKLVRAAALRAPRPGPGGRLVLLGLGKIAAELCLGARDALGDLEAVLAGPRDAPEVRGLLRGGHPLPDAGSLRAGEALLAAARALKPADAVLLLLSGGGSALAEAPLAALSLDDVRALNLALLGSGAPIEEMNCVRAHLSRLKGGGLARALHAAGVTRARALVAVDVPVGGILAVSSGPAAADPTTLQEARALAERLALPAQIREALRTAPETLKAGEPADFIEHEALCDLRSPAREAGRLGCTEIKQTIRGSVESVALRLAQHRGLCAASGEAELAVPKGAPPGGRDQHLALLMARALRGEPDSAFLAAGTDGRDGPTGSAGAVVSGTTWDEAEAQGLDPAAALAGFDAGRVLAALGLLLPSRHTGAHAGDLFLLRRS